MATFDPRQDAAIIQGGSMSGGGADTADTIPPYLVDWPKDGYPIGPDLVLGFSETIVAGTGASVSAFPILLVASNGEVLFRGTIANNPSAQISGSQLVLHLLHPLQYDMQYRLILPYGAVMDTAGNDYKGGAQEYIEFKTVLSQVAVNLTGTSGNDLLHGGALGDTLSGGLGNDTLDGDMGDDIIDGGPGDDHLDGGTTFRPVFGRYREGNDTLSGGEGNDTLLSWMGSDVLDGGPGNDELIIGDAHHFAREGDSVRADGGDGNDLITVDLYDTRDMQVQLTGGAGSDTFKIANRVDNSAPQAYDNVITITDFQAGTGGDQLDVYGSGRWTGITPFSDAQYRVIQRGEDTVFQYDVNGRSVADGYRDVAILKNVDKNALVLENTMGWRIDGSTKGELIEGTPGNDILSGGMLADTIHGGDGNDVIYGSGGNDLIDGGAGNDILLDGEGDDILVGGSGNDVLGAVSGNDLLQGGDGDDHLAAQAGKTVLEGGDGDDLLEFDSGVFFGLPPAFDITLDGGAGSDTFRVGNWISSPNQVTAIGGAGRDVFEASFEYSVRDFQAGADGDLIDVSGVLARFEKSTTPFATGHLRLVQNGADTLLQASLEPDGYSGEFSTVLVLKNLPATALGADNFIQHVDLVATTTTPAPVPVPVPPPPPPPPPPPVSTQPPPSTPGAVSTGGDGADTLSGTAGNDKLDGGAGNDLLHGGAGADLLIGGAGRDTAVYGGKAADYKISHDAAGWHVADQRSGGDGSDTLQGVERLAFADQAVALDLDGIAAQAYRIYRAAFDREPDLGGLGFWIAKLDAGLSLEDAAMGFIQSQEFTDLYRNAAGNDDIVMRLYHNILHRDPDPGGYQFWVDVLDNKQAPLQAVLASFSDSKENVEAVLELIGNGIVYTPYGG
jgi:Ca2+-binding RTX toxin-like protein